MFPLHGPTSVSVVGSQGSLIPTYFSLLGCGRLPHTPSPADHPSCDSPEYINPSLGSLREASQ